MWSVKSFEFNVLSKVLNLIHIHSKPLVNGNKINFPHDFAQFHFNLSLYNIKLTVEHKPVLNLVELYFYQCFAMQNNVV